ncbi:MAG: tetratricopeptide repeat protein, partial [Candidatus Acidiferrales bacterium]
SSSAAPAASGAAIPINPPAVAAKPLGNTAPSASTVAPAPSGLQTPASEVHPNASPNVKTSAALAADTGQTEFRRAQQYLNGTGGVVADPVEAAEWFWRSLEKGNTGAAIPLSDLYLQGKGVSQSCLQARILLTTASHKGNAEAIQKLLQLPENCEQ